jgi:hypothetical protein
MRCTRCDRYAVPLVLGRDRKDRLVFGWCPACLAETACTPVLAAAAPLYVRRPPLRRRLRTWLRRRRVRGGPRPREADTGGQRIGAWVIALLGIWASVLAVAGFAELVRPPRAATGAPLPGGAPMLLGGAVMLALIGLAFRLALAAQGLRVGRRRGLLGALAMAAGTSRLTRRPSA